MYILTNLDQRWFDVNLGDRGPMFRSRIFTLECLIKLIRRSARLVTPQLTGKKCGWAGCPWLAQRNLVFCCMHNMHHLITTGSSTLMPNHLHLSFILFAIVHTVHYVFWANVGRPHCSFGGVTTMATESPHPLPKPGVRCYQSICDHTSCASCAFSCHCSAVCWSHCHAAVELFSLSERPQCLKTSSNRTLEMFGFRCFVFLF